MVDIFLLQRPLVKRYLPVLCAKCYTWKDCTPGCTVFLLIYPSSPKEHDWNDARKISIGLCHTASCYRICRGIPATRWELWKGLEANKYKQSVQKTIEHSSFWCRRDVLRAEISLEYRTDLHIFRRCFMTAVRYQDKMIDTTERIYVTAAGPVSF